MAAILRKLFLPFFTEVGFGPSDAPYNPKQCGICYRPSPSVGQGYYWIFPVDDLFAVTVYDLVFSQDLTVQYCQPDFLCVHCYEAAAAQQISGGCPRPGACLHCHVGENDTYYTLAIKKDLPIRNVGISFMSDFYEQVLPDRFNGGLQGLKAVFVRMGGGICIPEVLLVLKQIRAAKVAASFSRLYYESKVNELISLILQWDQDQSVYLPDGRVPAKDMECLEEVALFLEKNYSQNISLDTLARLGCMSTSKLTSVFKQHYGLTITEYLQQLRIDEAKKLLVSSEWHIDKIAQAIGYKQHSSFSELFKRSTGLTPNEFRKHACPAAGLAPPRGLKNINL